LEQKALWVPSAVIGGKGNSYYLDGYIRPRQSCLYSGGNLL